MAALQRAPYAVDVKSIKKVRGDYRCCSSTWGAETLITSPRSLSLSLFVLGCMTCSCCVCVCVCVCVQDFNNFLQEERARSLNAGGQQRVEKQHARGKLTARERLMVLLDENSFREYDALKNHRCVDFGMDKEQVSPSPPHTLLCMSLPSPSPLHTYIHTHKDALFSMTAGVLCPSCGGVT